jgi:hypothetical protein
MLAERTRLQPKGGFSPRALPRAVVWLLLLSLALPPAARANPTILPGGRITLNSAGTDSPATGLTWDIVRSGSTIATNSTPTGYMIRFRTP